MKRCIICKQEKALSDFGKDSRLSDGLRGRCKVCYYSEFYNREGVKERRLRQWKKYISKARDSITDMYVIRQICHHNELTPEDVKKFPELIKAERQSIIVNRIIRHEKDKKHRGSQEQSS